MSGRVSIPQLRVKAAEWRSYDDGDFDGLTWPRDEFMSAASAVEALLDAVEAAEEWARSTERAPWYDMPPPTERLEQALARFDFGGDA